MYLLTAAKKKRKKIPLLKERKVRNKLTTYTIPAHYATQKNLFVSGLNEKKKIISLGDHNAVATFPNAVFCQLI